MGLGSSKIETPSYSDSYHITDTFVNHQEWKHTVKRINHSHPVLFSKEIVNVGYLFGSQPYIVFAIHDEEIKEKIRRACYNQPHITICNCILIFCARSDIQLITEFPDAFCSSSIRDKISNWWEPYQPNVLDWVKRQTYIALGFVIAACAEESIPCFPVDGCNEKSLSSIIELPSHLIPTAMLTVGSPD